jgi:predicted site-specific integrase-resolvase
MKFKNIDQQTLQSHLQKFDLPKQVVDKIILHADDNWIEQIILKLDSAVNLQEALSNILELFMLRNFANSPTYMTKKDVLKKFPISMRKFEEIIRARLIPFIEISNKNRVFNIDDIYNHLENYKVDSIVYKVDPISLQTAIINLKR